MLLLNAKNVLSKIIYRVFCLFLCFNKKDFFKNKKQKYNWKQHANKTQNKPILDNKPPLADLVSKVSNYKHFKKSPKDSNFNKNLLRPQSFKEKRLSV